MKNICQEFITRNIVKKCFEHWRFSTSTRIEARKLEEVRLDEFR